MRFLFSLLLLFALTVPQSEVHGQQQCPGSLPGRLVVGAEGIVLPGDSNNVRSIADLSGNRVGRIHAGSRFSVIDGPVCADGYTWWKIDDNGLIGWTVEGSSSAYWLEPIIPATQVPTQTSAPPTTSTDAAATQQETIAVSERPADAEGLIFYETFDNNDANWLTPSDSARSTRSGWSIDYQGNVVNGRYEIAIYATKQFQTVGILAPLQGGAWETTGNYEFSFDFTMLQATVRAVGISALFDIQIGTHRYFNAYAEDNTFSIRSADGTLSEEGVLALDLFDGKTHRVTVRVEETNYTVFIDGNEVPAQFPTLGQSVGRIGFSLGVNTFSIEGPQTFIGAFDNVELRQLNTQSTDEFAPFVTLVPRLALQTPRGWYEIGQDTLTQQGNSNEDVYNIDIFNNPDGRMTSPEDIHIRLIDPVQVMETTGFLDTSQAELIDVLTNYLGSSTVNRGTTEAITLPDGRDALRFSQGRKVWYALRSSDDSVALASVEFTQNESVAEFGAVTESIINTLDYRTPPRNAPQAQAVNRMITAMFSDNPDSVLLEICTEDAAATLLFIAGVDMMTDVWSGLPPTGTETLTARQVASAVVDTSGLYYDVISESDGVAQVRLMGNLRLVASDGTSEIRPMKTSIGPMVSRFGKNIYRLVQSGDRWVVCGGVFGF